LGIDIGSVALSLALLDAQGVVLHSSYRFHRGQIRETLRAMLFQTDCRRVGAVAATMSGPDIFHRVSRYDTQISTIAAVRHFYRKVGSILFVGGENFGLITFNDEGDYDRYRTNTSCAAGTGSFLDQQAARLNLKSIDLLSSVAFCNQDSAPRIATRCAVFAKTDLIHAQQEGYSVGQISDGLCEGLAKNVIDTLMPDQEIRTPLVLAGGVSMNQAVVKHFCNLLHVEPLIGEHSHLYGAIGAALLRREEGLPEDFHLERGTTCSTTKSMRKPMLIRHLNSRIHNIRIFPVAKNISMNPGTISPPSKSIFTPCCKISRRSISVSMSVPPAPRRS